MANIEIPKVAQKFIDDAKAAGFTVKVTHDSRVFEVWVEQGDVNAGLTWALTTVYDTPMSGERLGFRTSNHGSRQAVRFDYGTTEVRGTYTAVRSVRQARGRIGLTV